MKKQKVLRTERLVIYLTKDEIVRVDKAISKSKMPRSETIRSILLSGINEQSAALSK